ncbi:MAG TPA: cysteine--tRNA ligase, partial [Stellaceae bacterium]|nr:cysteine--tRNA ligase [Stellaceae bacterium]
AQLHEIASAVNLASADPVARNALQEQLRAGAQLLGLLHARPLDWLHGLNKEAEDIEQRLDERARARRERRFDEADRIRAELAAEGIVLEDRPDGTTEWRRA